MKTGVAKKVVGLLVVVLLLSFSIASAFAAGQTINIDPAKPAVFKQVSLGTGNTGTQTVEWDEKVSDPDSNVVVCVTGSDVTIGGYAEMAAIVRFNVTGDIDVRNGGAYDEHLMAYTPNKVYHIKMVVYVADGKYDVYVDGTKIADKAAFRTGSKAVKDVGTFAYTSEVGKGTITNLEVTTNKAAAPAPTTSAPASNPKTGDLGVIPFALVAAGSGVSAIALFRRKK